MFTMNSLPRLAGSLGICLLLALSCSTSKGPASQGAGSDMPAWFLDDRPMDPHHIFATATATAPKLQLASSKAASQARGDIAATIETKFEGVTKQFREEVGQGPNAESVSQFTKAYKGVISQTINGSEVVKREIQREDGAYRAYVLMRMPIGQAQEKLLRQIQTQERAFTRFRSSEAFEELEQEVDGYRRRQKDQEARRQGQSPSREEAQSKPSGQKTQQDPSSTEEQGAARAETEQEQPSEETSGAQVREGEAEAGETRPAGEKPTEEEIQAPEQKEETTPEQEEVQQNEGAPLSEAQRIESSLRQAMEPWMNVPYKFGGESKGGVDCSGLTQALYSEAFNVDLPRTTGQQVNRGRPVDRSQMRAGDLIFFRTGDQQKHVGIYLDDRTFVHASSSEGVTVSPLRYDYWQTNYWTTKRLSVL